MTEPATDPHSPGGVMPEQLSAIERKVYDYLLDFLTEHTYQPSVREIGRAFHIKSTKTVSEILQAIARKGYIERDPSRSRGVLLLGYRGTRRAMPVPYYTRFADNGALAPEHRAGYITVDRRFLPDEQVFFVKACGSGLADHGVLDGDYLLVDPASSPHEGEIAVSSAGSHPTVGVVGHRGAASVLEPASASVATASPPLVGRVCGVFRPFQEREDEPVHVEGNGAN